MPMVNGPLHVNDVDVVSHPHLNCWKLYIITMCYVNCKWIVMKSILTNFKCNSVKETEQIVSLSVTYSLFFHSLSHILTHTHTFKQ